MKAVKWYAPRDLRLVEIDKPVPKTHEALVRVQSVGICGSDLHYYLDGHIGPYRITDPLILGHEYAGVVEEVGGEADPGLVGQLVAVEPGIPCLKCEWCLTGAYNVCQDMQFPGGPPYDGALCEYVAVPAATCFPVPQSFSPADGAMIEPLAVAIHSVELAAPKPGETAAVLGLGPIGLLVAQVAKLSGVRVLFGTDLHDYRVAAGERYGIDCPFSAAKKNTVDTIMSETKGRGADIVFDCARSLETPEQACEIASPAGRCVLTGISGEDYGSLPVEVARRKELTLTWCRRFKYNFPAAIDLAASGKVDIRSLVTHSFPLDRTRDAFELVSGFEDNVLKASIDQ